MSASVEQPHTLESYLRFMVDLDASDLFLTVGAPPSVKVQGTIRPIKLPPLHSADVRQLAFSVMSEKQVHEFETTLECDLAANFAGLGRFRFNIYLQRGEVGLVARYIRTVIPPIEALHLPQVLNELALQKRGLVLVVGSAGSGKSTTLASMLEFRNHAGPGHILTVEDPIEYMHTHQKCLVDQREVGIDTLSFNHALRHAMREAPDVIMIGEIRDVETLQHAISYAESGHLCLSTLHANNAHQAIDRIINFFPETRKRQVLLDLSINLRAIVAQRLIPAIGGKQVPAAEVMINTSYIAELILKGDIDQISDVMAKNRESGLQTFDDSLFDLYQRGMISAEQAIENADSRTDLSIRIKLAPGHHTEAPHLRLTPEE